MKHCKWEEDWYDTSLGFIPGCTGDVVSDTPVKGGYCPYCGGAIITKSSFARKNTRPVPDRRTK